MWRERGVKKNKNGHLIRSPSAFLDTHIFSEAAIMMPIWGKLNPHVFFCLTKCSVQEESLWMQAHVGGGVETCYFGGKHQVAVVVFKDLPWTSTQLCVRKRSSAASSPLQSSVLKSSSKMLYENRAFKLTYFGRLVAWLLWIFQLPPAPHSIPPIFSLIVMRILRRQKKYWQVARTDLKHTEAPARVFCVRRC